MERLAEPNDTGADWEGATDSGRRLDLRRRARYGAVFDTLAAVEAELALFESADLDPALVEAAAHLRAAYDTTLKQLRGAMRQGYKEDTELDRAIRLGWERARSQLLLMTADTEERAPLTPREVQVLRGLAGGQANKQIAADLGISARTVRNHVSSIYAKLKVGGRAGAAVHAIRLGVFEP